MKLWLIGGILVGLLGVSLYLGAVKRSTPAPTPDAVIVVAEEPKPVPASLAITQVVDVTNIDHLLDPDRIVVHYQIAPSEQPQGGSKKIMIEGSTAGPERVIVNIRPSHIPSLTGENPNTILQAYLGMNSAQQVPVITRVGYDDELPFPQPSVDVKPIPRAVEDPTGPCGNEDIIRSEPGQLEPGALLLDRDAVAAPRVQPREIFEAYHAGAWEFDQPPSVAKPTAFEVHAKATSLAPLFFLSDSELLERGSVVNAHCDVVVRRSTSLQSSASQAPTSRLDWYTRWYGDDRLPMSFAPAILAEQPRKKSDQEERRQLFSFWTGVMSWN